MLRSGRRSEERDLHGSSISEWDGTVGKYLSDGGIIRAPGSFAVVQIIDGTASVAVRDGKYDGVNATGNAIFKFASGTFAALSGKVVRFEISPTSTTRFTMELSSDTEVGDLSTSKKQQSSK